MTIPWATILEMTAVVVPAPADVVLRIAAAWARAAEREGCTIDGCPIDLNALAPADIPTGERGLAAMDRAEARARGLDAQGLADRRSER